MKNKIAIITGASSGIGREFVRQLDYHTKTLDEVWVIARRNDRLLQLEKEMHNISLRILPFDLCKQEDINQFNFLLKEYKPQVRLLINAAGFGKEKKFKDLSQNEIENMISLNVNALTVVTHLILPYMTRPGNIIQMASASAFLPQKDFSVYAASKAFVLSFSQSLYAELKNEKITVTTVCPGPVDTEFLKISNDGKEQKTLKKIVTVLSQPVAYQALKDAKAGKILSVYGLPMKFVYLFSKIVPYRLYLR